MAADMFWSSIPPAFDTDVAQQSRPHAGSSSKVSKLHARPPCLPFAAVFPYTACFVEFHPACAPLVVVVSESDSVIHPVCYRTCIIPGGGGQPGQWPMAYGNVC